MIEDINNSLNFKSPSAWGETFDIFKELYSIKNYITVPNESNKRDVKNIKNKTCRFCNKNDNETTFNSLSHKIPKLLGNRFWYNEDECDKCNSLFHEYETNLGDFFGLERPIQRIKGGTKYPQFKTPGKGLEVKVGEFYNLSGVYVKQNSKENENFKYNKETGQLKIITKINPFIPLYVYKSFLKIALSLLAKEEIENYQSLLPFILNPSSTFIPSCPLAGYVLHSDAKLELQCLVFEKSNPNSKLPTHFFCLYWLNYIIIFHLPYHKNDMWMTNEFLTVPLPPPLFLNIDNEALEKLKLISFIEDFSSIERVKDKLREIILQINPDTMKELIGKNMDTGEITQLEEFDISRINGLFISKDEDNPTIYFDETSRN